MSIVISNITYVISPSNLTSAKEVKLLNWEDPHVVPDSVGLQTIKKWKEQSKIRSVRKEKLALISKYTEYQCEKVGFY